MFAALASIIGNVLGAAGATAGATAAAPTLGTMITKAAIPAITSNIISNSMERKKAPPRTISPRTSGRDGLSMSALTPQSLGQLQAQYGRRFFG